MSDADRTGAFELAIEPRSDGYHPDDERWRDQVAGLYSALHDQADVVQRGRALPGTKGTLDAFVVALGSAGAFTATLECFRAWLGRDRSRRIDVRWDDNGTERFVTLTGDAIDVDSVREIAKAAAQRVGGAAWPASTEPS
jgi:Effector Associated Constant Component 1